MHHMGICRQKRAEFLPNLHHNQKCVPEWWKIGSNESTAVNGLVVVI